MYQAQIITYTDVTWQKHIQRNSITSIPWAVKLSWLEKPI